MKVRGLQPAVWARPLKFTLAAILVMVPNMSLVKRDFLSACLAKKGKDSGLVHIRGLV